MLFNSGLKALDPSKKTQTTQVVILFMTKLHPNSFYMLSILVFPGRELCPTHLQISF